MRKNIFIISILLVAAMAISACSAGASTAPAPTSAAGSPVAPTTGTSTVSVPQTGSTTGTPAVQTAAPTSAVTEATSSATGTPAAAATTAATAPAATAVATIASTMAATDTPGAVVTTPLATQTTAAGAGTNGTPQAAVSDQFVRLSILLQSNLVTGSENGQITGVVIAQPQPSSTNGTAQVKVPYVRYVVVNTGSSAGETLLPWQMFTFSPVSTAANGGMTQNFTLNGTAASRSNAPRVTLPAETGVLTTGFDSQLAQYWAGQGFTVPVTGASQQEPGTQVILRKTVNGTNIVGSGSEALGQVADFLINPTTGEFAYAVFNTGPSLGNRQFVVPVQNLNFNLNNASAKGLGDLQLNITSELLKTAPSVTNLNQVPLDPALLQQLNTFWQNVQNSTK